MFLRVIFVAVIFLVTATRVQGDITIFTAENDWQQATALIMTETFDDNDLVSNLDVSSDNGSVSGGLWNDDVTDPLLGASATTTWIYSDSPTAWSTDIDLAPGGAGSGLDIDVTYTDLTTESLGTVDTTGFFGIVSDDKAIAEIVFSTTSLLGLSQEQFALDNFSSGVAVAVPEPSSFSLLSVVATLALLKRRRLSTP